LAPDPVPSATWKKPALIDSVASAAVRMLFTICMAEDVTT
jgi:hypothetical protein